MDILRFLWTSLRSSESLIFARSILLLSLATSIKACQTSIHQQRQLFSKEPSIISCSLSLLEGSSFFRKFFLRSVELDPSDSIAHFYRAQNFAFLNELGLSFASWSALMSWFGLVKWWSLVEKCLFLSTNDKYALHRYAILLTAQQQVSQPYRVLLGSLSLPFCLTFDDVVHWWPNDRLRKNYFSVFQQNTIEACWCIHLFERKEVNSSEIEGDIWFRIDR